MNEKGETKRDQPGDRKNQSGPGSSAPRHDTLAKQERPDKGGSREWFGEEGLHGTNTGKDNSPSGTNDKQKP